MIQQNKHVRSTCKLVTALQPCFCYIERPMESNVFSRVWFETTVLDSKATKNDRLTDASYVPDVFLLKSVLKNTWRLLYPNLSLCSSTIAFTCVEKVGSHQLNVLTHIWSISDQIMMGRQSMSQQTTPIMRSQEMVIPHKKCSTTTKLFSRAPVFSLSIWVVHALHDVFSRSRGPLLLLCFCSSTPSMTDIVPPIGGAKNRNVLPGFYHT